MSFHFFFLVALVLYSKVCFRTLPLAAPLSGTTAPLPPRPLFVKPFNSDSVFLLACYRPLDLLPPHHCSSQILSRPDPCVVPGVSYPGISFYSNGFHSFSRHIFLCTIPRGLPVFVSPSLATSGARLPLFHSPTFQPVNLIPSVLVAP